MIHLTAQDREDIAHSAAEQVGRWLSDLGRAPTAGELEEMDAQALELVRAQWRKMRKGEATTTEPVRQTTSAEQQWLRLAEHARGRADAEQG